MGTTALIVIVEEVLPVKLTFDPATRVFSVNAGLVPDPMSDVPAPDASAKEVVVEMTSPTIEIPTPATRGGCIRGSQN